MKQLKNGKSTKDGKIKHIVMGRQWGGLDAVWEGGGDRGGMEDMEEQLTLMAI